MNNVIITSFEPFGSYPYNPTQENAQYFHGRKVEDSRITGLVLPCTYFGAFEKLKKAVTELHPSLIISTGLSSSVRGIRFETTAKNIMDGKYPDANGYEPKAIPIIKDSQELFFMNAPHEELTNTLHQKGIPTELSHDADSFICNSLMYLTAHHLQKQNLPIQNVFVHIPWTDKYSHMIQEEPNKITIPRETFSQAIESIILILLDRVRRSISEK